MQQKIVQRFLDSPEIGFLRIRRCFEVAITSCAKDSPPHYGLLLCVHTTTNCQNRVGFLCTGAKSTNYKKTDWLNLNPSPRHAWPHRCVLRAFVRSCPTFSAVLYLTIRYRRGPLEYQIPVLGAPIVWWNCMGMPEEKICHNQDEGHADETWRRLRQ